MKFTSAQNNFSSGELSPSLDGRNDLKEYINGVSILDNAIPSKDGGAVRRPGSIFVRNITSDFSGISSTVGIYPMSIQKGESYLIALYTASSKLEVGAYSQSVAGSGRGTPVLVNMTVTYGAGFLTPTWDLSTFNANKFNYVQIFDTMVFTHTSGEIPPIVVIKTSPTEVFVDYYLEYAKTKGNVARALAFPPINTSNTTINVTNAGTKINCGTSAIFTADWVGTYIRIETSSTVERIYEVTNYVDTNNIDVTEVTGDVANYATQTKWIRNSWNNVDKYPRAVSLYQQRLCFGGTDAQSSTCWFSNTENLYLLLTYKLKQDSSTDVSGIDYFGSITNADAFDIKLTSNTSNIIYWMSSDRVLQVGTLSAEYVISTVDGKFGPSNSSASAQTFFGTNDTSSVRAQNETIFVSKDGKELRSIQFSFENGSNVSKLLSVLSDKMVYYGPTDQAYNQIEFLRSDYQPSRSGIWNLSYTNGISGLVVENSSNTLAWHRHTLGGDGDVKVLSMCVMPDSHGSSDFLYLVVQRKLYDYTVGSEVFFKYVEVIRYDHKEGVLYGQSNTTGENTPIYLDSAYVPTSVTGYDLYVPNLPGQKVKVTYQGISLGDFTVSEDAAGTHVVTLPINMTGLAAKDFVVGVPYKTRIKSMKIQDGSRTGDPRVQFKRIDTLLINLLHSKTLRIGTREDNTELVELNDSSDVNLFTGTHRVPVASTPSEEQRFYIETDEPYPLNVLSVGIRGMTQD